jgi:metal-responsive CopG/Arc/MetJ family transcriptional regulator
MKTAVSLPEDLFRRAEAMARKMRISRSQLYAIAISELLENQRTKNITERLNNVYSSEHAALDSALQFAQLHSVKREDW